MSAFEKKMLSLAIKAECKLENSHRKVAEKIKEDTAEGYMDTLIKILISVVLGVALLAALKVFIIDKFFPELEQQIMDMFTASGSSDGGASAPA